MQELILASSNQGKLNELRELLTPIRCISQECLGIESAEETGLTFIENAILKARHASHLGNKPALGDDSGLVIPALNGAPGIYSSRFAGENASDQDNINLVLTQIADLPPTEWNAYFYCAIALVTHANDPTPILAVGKFLGQITDRPQGNNGFGYDPIFYIPSQRCTAAQLPAKIKNSMSHRALALQQLKQQLSEFI